MIALAACLCFRDFGRSFAESGASALMVTHIAYCLVIQSPVIFGCVWPAILISIAASGLSATLIWRLRHLAVQTWHIIADFSRKYPLAAGAAALFICFRGTWTVFAAGTNLFPFPAGIMAYGSIGFATYALSRRHAWPPAALSATLVVLCMPRLVNPLLASPPELITTAAAMFVLMSLYRTIECLRLDDVLMLVLGLSCTWSPHPMGWMLPSILIFLTLLLIHRRHGWVHLSHLVWNQLWLTLAITGLAVMMSPAWHQFSGFIRQASRPLLPYNTEGLSGAADNFLRYVIQVAQINPSAHFRFWPIGLWWQEILKEGYQNIIHVLGGNLEAAPRFSMSTDAGFGPLSLMLVLPAVGYTMVQGPRRLRAMAISIGWYLFLLVLIPAWQPANIQLLTPMMAISGLTVAFFLPPWRFSRTGQFMLNLICLLSLFTAF
jgi:hypothetical protein